MVFAVWGFNGLNRCFTTLTKLEVVKLPNSASFQEWNPQLSDVFWTARFTGRDHLEKPSWSCYLALQYTSSCLLLSMLIVLLRRPDLFLLARIHTFDGWGIPHLLYVPTHPHLVDMVMLMGRVRYRYQARHWESSRASMIALRSLGSCCFPTIQSCKML